jgi:hypothetical protein
MPRQLLLTLVAIPIAITSTLLVTAGDRILTAQESIVMNRRLEQIVGGADDCPATEPNQQCQVGGEDFCYHNKCVGNPYNRCDKCMDDCILDCLMEGGTYLFCENECEGEDYCEEVCEDWDFVLMDCQNPLPVPSSKVFIKEFWTKVKKVAKSQHISITTKKEFCTNKCGCDNWCDEVAEDVWYCQSTESCTKSGEVQHADQYTAGDCPGC